MRAGEAAWTVEVPNPVGDADHHPLAEADVLALLDGWLDDDATTAAVRHVAAELPDAVEVTSLLQGLAR